MRHSGPIAGIATHGSLVATAGYDNRLILWNGETREAIARASHDHLVNACDFSNDGRWLVSASSDYSARIWSLPDLRLHAVLWGHGDDVDMACFSPGDALIATCALDRIVRVFSRDGNCQHELTGHTGNVLSLAWIDTRRLITTSVDGTLREWDAVTGNALRCVDLGMRSDCVVVSPDRRIFAGDDLGRIAILDEGSEPVFVPAHAAGVKKLVLARDGERLVSLAYDRSIAVWRIRGDGLLEEIARDELPPEIWARAASVCADGRLAVATFGGTYALFDPATSHWDLGGVGAGDAVNAVIEADGIVWTIGDAGILKANGETAGGPGGLCNFLIKAGNRLFAGGHLGELYDAQTGRVLHRHHSPLNCATTFARGSLAHLAVGTYTGEVLIFALGTHQPRLVTTLRPYKNAVKGLAATDGVLFSVCANTDAAWHSVTDWSELRRVRKAHDRIANACCALDGTSFASVGRDRMLRLWLADGEFAVTTPHPNSVKCMAASPCGRWIASGSYGGTVAVFDRSAMSFALMLRISKSGISALCWNSQEGRFLAASYDGVVHSIDQISLQDVRLAA